MFIDNDANAAALAEVYLGGAIQRDSLLFLLLNEGVGCGIVMNHQIIRGANGTAGEICELIVDGQNPTRSEYGQPGSLGALVGKTGLLQHYQQQIGKAAHLSDLVEALNQADPIARSHVALWAQRLGQGLINIINILNPECIVLGGPLTILLPYVKDQLNQRLASELPGNGQLGFFSTPNSGWKNLRVWGECIGHWGGCVGLSISVSNPRFGIVELIVQSWVGQSQPEEMLQNIDLVAHSFAGNIITN